MDDAGWKLTFGIIDKFKHIQLCLRFELIIKYIEDD